MTWKEAIGIKRMLCVAVCLALACALMVGHAAAEEGSAGIAYVASAGDRYYLTAAEAVENANGQVVTLLANADETIQTSGDLYLDLNGHSLTALTVTDGMLYGMDSSTDDYDCSDGYGKIHSFSGEFASHYKTDVTGVIRRYLAVSQDNALSFHRIYLGVTHGSLHPAKTGVGYKAVFAADTLAQSQLHETEAFGYTLRLESNTSVTRWKSADKFVSGKNVTMRVINYDAENFGESVLYAAVQVKLLDGTVITSAEYANTLRQMVESVNANTSSYTRQQLEALAAWIRSSETMLTWEVENILNLESTEYTVTFTDYDGTVIQTQKVKSGKAAVLPDAPTKSGTTFLGWTGNHFNITHNETVRAVYSDESNVFVIQSATVAPGDTVTLLMEVTGTVKTCGFDCDLFYDTGLELVSYDADLNLDVVVNDAIFENGLKMNFSSASDKIKQRDVVELTFQVSEDASGALPITLDMTAIKHIDGTNPVDADYVIVCGVVTVDEVV